MPAQSQAARAWLSAPRDSRRPECQGGPAGPAGRGGSTAAPGEQCCLPSSLCCVLTIFFSHKTTPQVAFPRRRRAFCGRSEETLAKSCPLSSGLPATHAGLPLRVKAVQSRLHERACARVLDTELSSALDFAETVCELATQRAGAFSAQTATWALSADAGTPRLADGGAALS